MLETYNANLAENISQIFVSIRQKRSSSYNHSLNLSVRYKSSFFEPIVIQSSYSYMQFPLKLHGMTYLVARNNKDPIVCSMINYAHSKLGKSPPTSRFHSLFPVPQLSCTDTPPARGRKRQQNSKLSLSLYRQLYRYSSCSLHVLPIGIFQSKISKSGGF